MRARAPDHVAPRWPDPAAPQQAHLDLRVPDIDAAENFITSGVLAIALDLVTLAGMLCVMFYLDPHFSLIALSTAPLLFLLVHRFMHRIKQAARDVKNKESELASVVQESIASARTIANGVQISPAESVNERRHCASPVNRV